MKEYIERGAALSDEMCEGISCQECPFLIHPVNGGCKVVKYINGIPAADVVEQKHGSWQERIVDNDEFDKYGFFHRRFYCSACGDWNTHGASKYCPHCGAKMTEV